MTDQTENKEYTKDLGEALASVSTEVEKDDGLIHLSTGVVLKTKRVAPFIFQEVALKFKYPDVPVIFDENKGRNEPNPQSPKYLAEIEEIDTRRGMATVDAVIALGTELVSTPEDFYDLNNDDWLDDLEAVEIIIDRNNKRLRYRTWVKYFAAPSVEDIQHIIQKVLRATGVTEEAVAEATANFQNIT